MRGEHRTVSASASSNGARSRNGLHHPDRQIGATATGPQAKSVEDMGTEPVSRWNVGVLEVRRRIANHAEAFHYLPRPDVVWVGEGNDLVKTDLFESVANGTTSRLGHESIAPVLAAYAPSDFGRRPEGSVKRHSVQPDKANERRVVRHLYGPPTETAVVELLLDARHECVALLSAHGLLHVRHYVGIGVEFGKGC